MQQNDLQRAVTAIVPAVAAVVFLGLKRRGSKHGKSKGLAEDEGDEIKLDLTSKGRGKRGDASSSIPPPLKVSLLETNLPIPLNKLWTELFGPDAKLVMDLHTELKDKNIRMGPWRRKGDNAPTRTLRFITPLSNPFGPKQAINTEVFTAECTKPTEFVVQAVCTSEGVPFGGAFGNFVQWVAVSKGGSSCQLTITGECRFLGKVWGPLKGTIERESIKGMSRAYGIFGKILADRHGATVGEIAASSWFTRRRIVAVALLGSITAVSAVYLLGTYYATLGQ